MKKWFIVLLLIIMLLSPGKLQAANNRERPLNATNVKLVKKFLFALHRKKVNHPELLQLEFLGNHVRVTSMQS
jgi:hypothetical protein